MKTINSLISVIVLIVMLVSPQGNVSAIGEIEAPQQSLSKLVWESKPDMPTARYNMGAAVSGGKIYVIGGDNWGCTPLTDVEEYDPATGSWNIRTSMLTGRWGLGVATGSDGKIYAMGGSGGDCGSVILDTVEIYDPTTDSWNTGTSMPTQRIGFRVASANGKIYVFGGENSTGWLATVEEYDPATDVWTSKANMPYPNKSFSITSAANGKIYLVDGDANAEDLWEYDPINDIWNWISKLPTSRFGSSITQASNGRLYVVGGSLNEYMGTVEAYDLMNNAWSVETSISLPRGGHVSVSVDDYIYVIGGGSTWPDGNFKALSSVEAGTFVPLPQVIYAVPGGQTSGMCDSWANACELQYALISAVAGQEIWAAAGVYKPGTARTDTFQLKNGVGLYGGFAGMETSRDERNWETNRTILSGDIDNNDINNDGNFIAETTADIQGGNAYHIVTGSNIDNSTVLDGFTITAGQANSPGYYHGGGMFNEYYSSPILTNIVFSANMTSNTPDLPGDGGGMYNFISSPILINVTFFANSASSGGGLYNSNSSSTILTSVLFSNNSAGSGGGMFISDGNPELNNVIFYANSASWSGGGLFNSHGSPRLINTTFFENSAVAYGGGMDSSTYNPPSLISNIFWRNSAPNGPQISASYDSLNVTYSDVQGGWPGTGNINADPLFVDATNGDLHLQAGSPAIDSGTNNGCPASDFDGVIRPQDGNYDGIFTCDMGAYEIAGGPTVPPANDNFTDASVIDALPLNDVVSNVYATIETGEPQSCSAVKRTVWYKFTPTENMRLKVDVTGSDFADPFFSVYQSNNGAGFGDLSLLHCAAYDTPEIFDVETGVTYYIQAGSIDSLGGALHLNVQEVLPPPNDNFANATVILPPLPFDETMDAAGSSTETGEPVPYCAVYSGLNKSVWYAYTPTNDGILRASVPSAVFVPILSVYTGSDFAHLRELGCVSYTGEVLAFPVVAGNTYYFQISKKNSGDMDGSIQFHLEETHPPENDNFANATLAASLPFSNAVNMTDATTESGEQMGCYSSSQTVWYSFTPSANMLIQVDTSGSSFYDSFFNFYQAYGPDITDLNHMYCSAYGNPLMFMVQAGVTYYIQAGSMYYSSGTLQLNIKELPRPVNDDFDDAIKIEALPYTNTQDASNATSSPDDPTTCTNNGSVWYQFTATSDSIIDADTIGSNYDTVLSVYTGVRGSLVQVTGGCNDDYYGLQSHIAFPATSGTTYYFMIGRCCGSGGSGGGYLQFNVKELIRPANDDFAKAKAIDTLPYNDEVDISNATIESGEPTGCYWPSKTVWYTFTPGTNMLIQVDTSGSSFYDSFFNFYQSTGPGFNGLTHLQCASYGNPLMLTVQAGATYYIQAGSMYGSGGTLKLNIRELPRPANDDFANATNISALPFEETPNTQYATREADEPMPSCRYSGAGERSVWYAYTPTISGSISASIPWATVAPVLAVYTGSSLSNLTEIGCRSYNSSLLTFRANAGNTYYFQISNFYYSEGGGEIDFRLDVAPQPVAVFDYIPANPSTFDTIHFDTFSYDPGYVNFESLTWNFGDGTTSTEASPEHKYARDGDYTVQHSVITFDGRTASTSQVVHVKTSDVAITKLSAPQSASPGQTRTITVSVSSKAYSETVQIDLYRSVAGGFELIGTLTQVVPARSSNRTVAYNFNYTFTSSDASIGKVTFRAVATIVNGRDIYPADNEAYSLPTKVNKRR